MSGKEFRFRMAKVALHAIGITILAILIGIIGGPFIFWVAITADAVFVAGSMVEFYLDLRHR